jgi:Zn-dependent protease
MIGGLPSIRFSVGRVPVQIELFHFLTVLLLGIPESRGYGTRFLLLWVAVAVPSVLAHELVHAFTLQRMRRAPEVVLHILGGSTVAAGTLPARQKVLVNLLPSITMLLLVGIPARLWYETLDPGSLFLWRLAFDLYWVNVWWSVLNLLPVWPLDGGNVLAGLNELRGNRVNWRLVHTVSAITAGVGGLYVLARGDDNFYVFVFAAVIVVQNVLRLRGSRWSVHPIYADDGGDGGSLAFGASVPRPSKSAPAPPPPRRSPPKGKPADRLERAFAALERGDGEAARIEAQAVRSGKASAEQRAAAAEVIAWSYLQERNVPRARAALADLEDRSGVSPLLMAALEITGGDEQRALERVAAELARAPEGPATRQVVDYLGRRGLGVRLAEQLLALPGGEGFEAAVRLVAVLAACGRRDQADAVSGLLFGT